MPKKSVHAKKKVRKSAKKQTFFEKYLTFPKLAAIMFIALLLVWLYQVTLPTKTVGDTPEASASSSK